MCVEIPASTQINPHGLQVAVAHHVDKGLGRLMGVRVYVLFIDGTPAAIGAQWQSVSQTRGYNTLNRFPPPEDFIEVVVTQSAGVILRARIDAQSDGIFRTKTQVAIQNA